MGDAETIDIGLDFTGDVNADTTTTEVENTNENDGSVAGTIDGAEENATEQGAEDEVKPGADGKYDARTLPKAVQSTLKQLRETNPQIAKTLNDAFFRQQQFEKEFPQGLATVRELKATIDSVGGPEGLATLQQNSEFLEKLDEDFKIGNDAVLKDMWEDFPDGMRKLIPTAIDQLQQKDFQAYAAAMRPHFAQALIGAGFEDTLSGIWKALNSNDAETAKKSVQSLYGWFKNLEKEAEKKPAATAVDPARQQFEKERADFQKTKDTEFRSGVGSQVHNYRVKLLDKSLLPYLKGHALSEAGKQEFAARVFGEIEQQLKADNAHQRQMKTSFASKARNAASIARYVNSKYDALLPKIVKAKWEAVYGTIKAKPGTGGKPGEKQVVNRVGGNTTPFKVAKKPAPDELDKSKDPNGILEITGKGYLKKTGQFVTWR